MMTQKQKIVIAGGGFGGVRAALKLARSGAFDITLISDHTTFRYYPALYATATGHAYDESIIPIDDMIGRYPVIQFVHDSVTTLNAKKKQISTASGQVHQYDFLIIAVGMVTNYFGIPGLQESSFGIKSQEEIKAFRAHIHTEIEAGKVDANYVVVGGGPTGIELGASLRAHIEHIAKNHDIETSKTSFILVEAMERLLPKMPARAGRLIQRRLAKLGIEVRTNAKVEAATSENVTINGEVVESKTVIWTSGVANNPFFETNRTQFKLSPNKKVAVDEFLQGAPSVYVIGDNANTPYSGLAQTALYDADFVAKNLIRQARHAKPKTYKPYNPPVVIPVGKRWALVKFWGLMFAGWPGALLRRVADLIGYADVLPLSKALSLSLRSGKQQADCEICETATTTKSDATHEN